MQKWVLAVVAVVGVLGVLLWQLGESGPAPIPDYGFDAASPVASPAADAAPYTFRKKDAGLGDATEEIVKYDPQSEEFSHQIDVRIPDRFRASLARCEREGLDPDAKITISYQLHIEDGVVSASNVRVLKSDLGDTKLEQCMVSSIQQARWVAADMPDFAEESEVFIRIRSLNKYLDKEEQEAAKARDQVP